MLLGYPVVCSRQSKVGEIFIAIRRVAFLEKVECPCNIYSELPRNMTTDVVVE